MQTPGDVANGRLVYRDGARPRSGVELADRLTEAMTHWASLRDRASAMTLLLLAGEVECGLSDLGHPARMDASRLTDRIAVRLVGRAVERADDDVTPVALPVVAALRAGATVTVAPPEGFAYYGLDPLGFADAGVRQASDAPRVAVIGIRTIGATLSAVVAAALSSHGRVAARTTVRPSGHPFDRRLRWRTEQLAFVTRLAQSGAFFIVVDEGPGLSGSSFLAVAEALEREGLDPHRIVMLGSRPEDGRGLCADGAVRRWQRFRFVAAPPTRRLPAGSGPDLSGGRWRASFLAPGRRWPAVWPQTERMKTMHTDGRTWFKFEGFGPFSADAGRRQRLLADAGFVAAPTHVDADTGFVQYPVLAGRILERRDLTPEVVERLAEYIAFRAASMRASEPATDLETPTRANVAAELQFELPVQFSFERGHGAVLTDGRMMPHEWLLVTEGQLLKTDAVDHGDDHFLPGPTDPAWDLAGAVVEWSMGAGAADDLVSRYHALSGDDVRARLSPFLVAYAAFHVSRARLAAASCARGERRRLLFDVRRYRRALISALRGVRDVSRYCTYLVGDHIPALGSSGGRDE